MFCIWVLYAINCPHWDFMPKTEKPGTMAGEVDLGRGLDWVGVGRAYVTVSKNRGNKI